MRTSLRYSLIFVTIGGGCGGIISALRLPFTSDLRGLWNYALLIAFIALYGFVIASGVLLWRNPRRVLPILIALAIQLPMISTPVLSYEFAAGPRLDLQGGAPDESYKIGFRCGFGGQLDSSFRLAIGDEGPARLGTNLVALVFFVLTPVPSRQKKIHFEDSAIPRIPPA